MDASNENEEIVMEEGEAKTPDPFTYPSKWPSTPDKSNEVDSESEGHASTALQSKVTEHKPQMPSAPRIQQDEWGDIIPKKAKFQKATTGNQHKKRHLERGRALQKTHPQRLLPPPSPPRPPHPVSEPPPIPHRRKKPKRRNSLFTTLVTEHARTRSRFDTHAHPGFPIPQHPPFQDFSPGLSLGQYLTDRAADYSLWQATAQANWFGVCAQPDEASSSSGAAAAGVVLRPARPGIDTDAGVAAALFDMEEDAEEMTGDWAVVAGIRALFSYPESARVAVGVYRRAVGARHAGSAKAERRDWMEYHGLCGELGEWWKVRVREEREKARASMERAQEAWAMRESKGV